MLGLRFFFFFLTQAGFFFTELSPLSPFAHPLLVTVVFLFVFFPAGMLKHPSSSLLHLSMWVRYTRRVPRIVSATFTDVPAIRATRAVLLLPEGARPRASVYEGKKIKENGGRRSELAGASGVRVSR